MLVQNYPESFLANIKSFAPIRSPPDPKGTLLHGTLNDCLEDISLRSHLWPQCLDGPGLNEQT